MITCPNCTRRPANRHVTNRDNGGTFDWCGYCAAQKIKRSAANLVAVDIAAVHLDGATCNRPDEALKYELPSMREAELVIRVRVQYDPARHLTQVLESMTATVASNPMVPDREHITVERSAAPPASNWREDEG